METTNLNIRTDREVKLEAEKIFEELGLSMTTAINIFLRQTIRENGMPFALNLVFPNATTAAAISEGINLAQDRIAKCYRLVGESVICGRLWIHEVRGQIYKSVQERPEAGEEAGEGHGKTV